MTPAKLFQAESHAGTLDLPITEVLEQIRDTLAEHNDLVVEAPPGAGKTTVIPLSLLDAPWLGQRRILMLQPRRIAARNAANRMAELMDERPGETVGYRMRLETRVGPTTRIEVVTEGVLLRMLADDPSLDDVGLLIFDEFHERSLDGDLGLALACHSRDTFERDIPLKLLVMSATLDQSQIATYLNCSVVRSKGRMYPVSVNYRPAKNPRERIAERIVPVIEDAVARHADSSILVFLPGQGEINQVAKSLSLPKEITVHPLLGSLPISAQQSAIAPSPPGKRKVVLATNVAETSLTIDGVDVVIDAGLERRPVFDPNTGMSRLHTVKISQASAEQRKGRAGRLAPGACYRLWSEPQQEQLAPHLPPEIDEADLAALVLQLFDWGIYDPADLAWLSAPPGGTYAQALDLLTRLGAIEHTEHGPSLTAHGTAMARMPTHPRLAHMLLAGSMVGAARRAALLAAVLSDRDPLTRDTPDMAVRIDYLESDTGCPSAHRGWRDRTRKLAQQLREQLPSTDVTAINRPDEEQLTGYLIACAYPERIARRRHSGGYQLANGRSAQFAEPHSLEKSRWLAIAEVGGLAGRRGDVIRSATEFDKSLFSGPLASLLEDTVQIDWEQKSGRFVAERQLRCGALTVKREALAQIPEGARVEKLIALVREASLKNLSWNDASRRFVARCRQLHALTITYPDFSEHVLTDTLEEWLSPYLSPIQKLTDLKKLDLLGALKARLSWEELQELERQLPERFEVPSGSNIAINYSESPPVLAVKLQEMFGCADTPSVADGRLPLMVHLLSPAGRPLQVTQDLRGFWESSYHEVRKEMRGRYPKHPWPEDPATAAPTRHTKRRQGP